MAIRLDDPARREAGRRCDLRGDGVPPGASAAGLSAPRVSTAGLRRPGGGGRPAGCRALGNGDRKVADQPDPRGHAGIETVRPGEGAGGSGGPRAGEAALGAGGGRGTVGATRRPEDDAGVRPEGRDPGGERGRIVRPPGRDRRFRAGRLRLRGADGRGHRRGDFPRPGTPSISRPAGSPRRIRRSGRRTAGRPSSSFTRAAGSCSPASTTPTLLSSRSGVRRAVAVRNGRREVATDGGAWHMGGRSMATGPAGPGNRSGFRATRRRPSLPTGLATLGVRDSPPHPRGDHLADGQAGRRAPDGER